MPRDLRRGSLVHLAAVVVSGGPLYLTHCANRIARWASSSRVTTQNEHWTLARHPFIAAPDGISCAACELPTGNQRHRTNG